MPKAGEGRPWLTVERLGAITDGVVAIIITILVLEIDVPKDHDFGAEGVFSLLRKISRDIIVYLLSFCLIGVLWLQHYVIFHYVARTDRNILFLTGLFLFLLSLSPFTTALAGTYPGVRPAEVLFGVNYLLGGVSLLVLWLYVSKREYLLKKPIEPTVVRSMSHRIMVAPLLVLLGMVVSLYNFHLAALLYFIAPVFYLTHRRADSSWQADG
jgi:uncharacterized membrane protein